VAMQYRAERQPTYDDTLTLGLQKTQPYPHAAPSDDTPTPVKLRPRPVRRPLPQLSWWTLARRWLSELCDPRGWAVAHAERCIVEAQLVAYEAEMSWHQTRWENGGREHFARWKCAERDREQAARKLVRALGDAEVRS
jgi:hypothetical protein